MARIADIRLRRDTAANWTSTNPTLSAGEVGLETDTLKAKVGTGAATWTGLSYAFQTTLLTSGAAFPSAPAAGVRFVDSANNNRYMRLSNGTVSVWWQEP